MKRLFPWLEGQDLGMMGVIAAMSILIWGYALYTLREADGRYNGWNAAAVCAHADLAHPDAYVRSLHCERYLSP